MKKIIISILSLCMTLIGCTKEKTADPIIIEDAKEVKQDNRMTSIQIADQIYNTIEDNIMFSPLSLNMALGLLYEGAKGNTKEVLEEYLGIEDFKDFAYYYNYRIQDLNEEGEENGYAKVFEIANALYINQNNKLLDDYSNIVKQYYFADLQSLDFSQSVKCAKIINSYCDTKTHHMISNIIDESMINENLFSILLNTVYFESPWKDCFEVEEYTNEFTNLDRTVTKLQYLYSSEASNYYENDHAIAFSYPYANGLSFIGILPKQEGDFTLSSLDLTGLLESHVEADEIRVRMPGLDFDTTIELTDILKNNGLENIFINPDFRGISDQDLRVSDIIQKTKIELTENGTKAAAVTMITNETMMLLPEEQIVKEINLNRPYAFMIYDYATDQIIFIGKVINMK